MKKWTRLLSLVLCLGILLSLSAVAHADKAGTCGENLTWRLEGTTLTISGKGAMWNYNLGGSPWNDECERITKIVIKSGVTSIGDNVFFQFSKLKAVIIPDSVTSIGTSAFESCTSLVSVVIPDSVRSIGVSAFFGCSDLWSVTIPDGVTSIESFTFENCGSLTTVNIPDSVTFIGGSAFRDCSSLKDVYYAGTKSKRDRIEIYNGNEELTNATWHYSGSSAANACGDNLTWTLESGTLTISGKGAIWDFEFDDIPWYDKKDAIKKIVIKSGVTRIGEHAFFYCKNLTSVTIPDSVTSIGTSAFSYCESLPSITIPSSVTTIESNAFGDCSSLTSATVPKGVTVIDYHVFSNCSSLRSITIPEGVTTVKKWAFSECSSLEDVYYAGTKSDRKKMDVDDESDSENEDFTYATWHYGS